MQKKIKVSISFIVIIFLFGLIIYFLTKPLEENITLRNKIITSINNSNVNNTPLDISDLNDFKWDSLYIVTPYYPLKDYCSNNNINYRKLNTTIEYNDSINLLLFVNDKEIINYIELKRTYGEFNTHYIPKEKSILELINNTWKMH